jgi:murein DD-endopeptidase MepM/ murein hydrolase activator NlpD
LRRIAPVIYTNPVRGIIHPLTWSRPSGNHDAKVTQRFGCTGFIREPAFGSCAHFHRGLDISTAGCGAAVLAAAHGKVHFVGRFSDGNLTIVISHGNGNVTTYGHLATELVSKGDLVSAGQKIGTIGDSGNATGCHLHFGVKIGANLANNIFSDSNGTWVDPWPRLVQNVTIRPKGSGIFLRNSQGSGTTLGPKFAVTLDTGTIRRLSDNANLGLTSTMRKYGGEVIGASYTVNGVVGNKWDLIFLDGAFRYIAAVLAVKSIS